MMDPGLAESEASVTRHVCAASDVSRMTSWCPCDVEGARGFAYASCADAGSHPMLNVLLRTNDGRAFGLRSPMHMSRTIRDQAEEAAQNAMADVAGRPGNAFPSLVAEISGMGDTRSPDLQIAASHIIGCAERRALAGESRRTPRSDEGGPGARAAHAGDLPKPRATGFDWEEPGGHAQGRIHESLRKQAVGAITHVLRHARAFLATLDPWAVAVVRGDGMTEVRDCQRDGLWEALDGTFAGGAPLKASFLARPDLPNALLRSWLDDPGAFAARTGHGPAGTVRAALATLGLSGRAARLVDRIADPALGADLDGLARRSVTQRGVDASVTWATLLERLPPSWVPAERGEWDALVRCQPALTLLARSDLRGHDAALLLNAGGRWDSYEGRLRRAAGGPRALATVIKSLDDVASAFTEQVLLPAVRLRQAVDPDFVPDAPSHFGDASAALLWSGRSLARIVETSTRWHARQEGIADAVESLALGDAAARRWGPAFPDLRTGDLEVVVLADEAALREEGRQGPNRDGTAGLAHCVGGYGPACLRGESRILSVRRILRDGTRVRLSTAEVTWRDGLVQHRGHANADPDEEAVEFLAGYLTAVLDGTLRVVEEELAPVEATTAPYDPRVPGTWDAVRAMWRPFAPRSAIRQDLVTFTDMVVGYGRLHGARRWCPDPYGTGTWLDGVRTPPRP